jgi:hypothetical protein
MLGDYFMIAFIHWRLFRTFNLWDYSVTILKPPWNVSNFGVRKMWILSCLSFSALINLFSHILNVGNFFPYSVWLLKEPLGRHRPHCRQEIGCGGVVSIRLRDNNKFWVLLKKKMAHKFYKTTGFDSRRRKRIFPVAFVFRSALRSTQHPIQSVPGFLSWGWSTAETWRWPLTSV